MPNELTPQVTFPGRLVRVIDGDTVEVEVTRKVKVRLRDCWAPETRQTRHPSERPLGIHAREVLADLSGVVDGPRCTVQVLTDGDDDIGDGLTFGRVVGRVVLSTGVDIGAELIAQGYARATKADLERYLTEQDAAYDDI